jgi:zinc transport system substrate-binding protein
MVFLKSLSLVRVPMVPLLMGILLGCASLPTVVFASSPPTILASIKPLQLIVTTMHKALLQYDVNLEVSTLLPPGATPHDYVLKPSDIAHVLQADVVLWMGPSVEPYLVSVIARAGQDKVIDVSQLEGLKRLAFRELLENDEGHEDDKHHGHDEMLQFDPHIWWSVDNAEIIATRVLATLDVQGDIQGSIHGDSAEKRANKKRSIVSQAMEPIRSLLAIKQTQAIKQKPSFILFHDGLQYLESDLGVLSAARVALNDGHRPGIKTLLALRQKVNRVVCVVAETNTNVSIIHKIEATTPLRQIIIDSLGWGQKSYHDMLQHAYDEILGCHR